MVQLPAVSGVSVVPATVHTDGVVEVNITVRLESALADKVAGVPTFCAPGDVKVMVCFASIAPDAAATLKEWTTGVAALKLAFPLWFALNVQVPAATNFNVLLFTAQTAGVLDVMVTASPDVADEVSAWSAAPSV